MTKYAAKGTLLLAEIAAVPGTYQTVGQVRNLAGPTLAGDGVDLSHHDVAAGYRVFKPGLNDAGEVTVELLFDPVDPTQDDVGVDGLLSIYDQREVHNFRMTFSDVGLTQWDFAALITGYEPAAPHDEALTATITLKLSGQPAFAT